MAKRIDLWVELAGRDGDDAREKFERFKATIPQWRTFVDRFIVNVMPSTIDLVFGDMNWARGLNIVPGLKTVGNLGRTSYAIDSREGWENVRDSIAKIKALAGGLGFALECEDVMEQYCDADEPRRLENFRNAMQRVHSQIGGSLLWYPAVSSSNPQWQLRQRQIIGIVGYETTTFVDTTYNKPGYFDLDFKRENALDNLHEGPVAYLLQGYDYNEKRPDGLFKWWQPKETRFLCDVTLADKNVILNPGIEHIQMQADAMSQFDLGASSAAL